MVGRTFGDYVEHNFNNYVPPSIFIMAGFFKWRGGGEISVIVMVSSPCSSLAIFETLYLINSIKHIVSSPSFLNCDC